VTYTVTFVLAGFSTVLREGIALESNCMANIDAALRIGSIEETVTAIASGAGPSASRRSSSPTSCNNNSR